MSTIRKFVAGATVAATLVATSSLALAAGVDQKAALQAAAQQHINRSLVNDAYLDLDIETGETRKLFPIKAHPMIVKMDDIFVLCTDFKDESGKSVNIDIYVAQNDDSYVVFETIIDDRAMLMRRMKNGTAKRYN